MQIQFELAPWGVFFAAAMYIVGNGVWVNHVARQKVWLGWAMWVVLAPLMLVAGALLAGRMDGGDAGVWQRLTSVAMENHWIVVSLFALISVPGAASVLFKLDAVSTRMALLLPALVVFVPIGKNLGQTDGSPLVWGLGVAFAVCGLTVLWQVVLDKPATEEARA